MSKKLVGFKGREMTLSELSREYDIPWTTLKQRYSRGLRDDKLVEQGNLNAIIVNGKKTTFEKLSNETGIPAPTLSQRYQKGLRGVDLVRINDYVIVIDEEEYTFSELSRKTGIPRSTLSQRYSRGLRGDKLLEEGKLNVISLDGDKTTYTSLAERTGIPKTTLEHRYRKGSRGDELFDNKRHGIGNFGEESTNHKLNNDSATSIKNKLDANGMTQREIAKQHEISEATVSDIKHKKRWQHI